MKWRTYRNQILSMLDNAALFLGELEASGAYIDRHGSEVKTSCPFTERHLSGTDNNPSFTINLDKGVFFCNSCRIKGNAHTFYARMHNLSNRDAWLELGDALGLERPSDMDSRPGIDPGLPSAYHAALKKYEGVAKERLFTVRGLTQETLDRFCLGWDGERITIPIYNELLELVNIRLYKWNSLEDSSKMKNYADESSNAYGEATLYGVEHLFNPDVTEIVWCEGEFDRLIAEQHGLNAITATGGANTFSIEWYELIRNWAKMPSKKPRTIFLCYDNDVAGKLATESFIANLRNDVNIQVVNWPDTVKDKCDITDIFVEYKYTCKDFLKLFKPLGDEQSAPTVQLAASSNAKYTGKRIKIPVLVAGKENAPFIFPKHAMFTCDNYSEDNKLCASCALAFTKRRDVTLASNTPILLQLIDCTDAQKMDILKKSVGIPGKCNGYTFTVKEYGNLENIHMIPKADTNISFTLRQEYVTRTGYMIGNNLPTNKKYTVVGYMHANPNTQRATYIFDTAIPEKDILDELIVTPELHERLKVFQCKEGQSVASKFDEIHTDLERNVTYIWDRRKVAYAVDLVYHTVLSFTFQEQQVKRGWAECLIIGDSGQAKTTLVERLMAHYKCGEMFSGEAARRTGLVYSLQQNGSKGQWMLIWGAMPLNDGGLLTIDELSGMPEEDLAKMSDVRSSGIAKSTGVVTAETTARTRMIFISNPRNGRQLKENTYGIQAILKLFGKAEDVRRLDFAVTVASGEVDADIVNKSITEMPTVPHVYTSELCRERVLWAWSRRPNQVLFEPDATEAILNYASIMGKTYSSRIPLVEPADQRLKLARLAVSTAACVYSTDDGTNVIVKKEHVDFVYDYLQSIYKSKSLGYDRMSLEDFTSSDTTDGAMQVLRNKFMTLPFATHTHFEVVKALYKLPYFNRNALEDATGLERDELKSLLQFMISNAIVERVLQDYKRTPTGLAFIEALLENPPTEDEAVEARRRKQQNEGSDF